MNFKTETALSLLELEAESEISLKSKSLFSIAKIIFRTLKYSSFIFTLEFKIYKNNVSLWNRN